MKEATLPSQNRHDRWKWVAFWKNPVTIKELRGRMRGGRAFLILTLYLFMITGVVSLIYLTFFVNSSSRANIDMVAAGEAIFVVVLVGQAFLVVMIAPIFTTGAISGERERQTYEILRTTLLPAHRLVSGKLLSSLGYVLLLVLAAVPVQSIAFLLGGVTLLELLLTQTLLLFAAVTFSTLGLLCSSTMRSTMAASAMTMTVTLGSIVAGPLFLILEEALRFGLHFSHDGLMFLSMTNLAFALNSVVTDYRSFRLATSVSAFLILYGMLSCLFFLLTLHKVRRMADS